MAINHLGEARLKWGNLFYGMGKTAKELFKQFKTRDTGTINIVQFSKHQ